MTQAPQQWTSLCSADEVPAGEGRRFEPDGFPALAVFNVDGEFHVTDDLCTHGDASLADGWIEGEEVECPFHAGKFCLRTGEATAFPAEIPVQVYRCRVEDGTVQVLPPDPPTVE
ncbi:MAG: bifunctional 3-phenylpropionate/cinnamic acid dioxygenase ferredoxin subunit [Burkholderiaceae bacterium]